MIRFSKATLSAILQDYEIILYFPRRSAYSAGMAYRVGKSPYSRVVNIFPFNISRII
jgi:hypothetical protein